jgi:hypothetical protein
MLKSTLAEQNKTLVHSYFGKIMEIVTADQAVCTLFMYISILNFLRRSVKVRAQRNQRPNSCYSQSPLLTDLPPPPPSKSGLKLNCNVHSQYYAQKPQRNCMLKVDGNEKRGGLGRRQ